MVVLILGDIVGQAGCDFVRTHLHSLKAVYKADFVVANGENASNGNGLLPVSAQHLFDSGVDVITSGNHILQRREIYEMLDKQIGIIRPANYHHSAPGTGMYIHDGGGYAVAVISLQGVIFLDNNENPFDCIDRLLKDVATPNIIVDFHAEATSEKLCMGYYLDGRVSVVTGTHTHVQTADERILPGGTAYITDLGMCGGYHSVLGVKSEHAIMKMRTNLPQRFIADENNIWLTGIAVEIDVSTGRALHIERIQIM